MPKPPLKNPGASVRARLQNLARARKQPFDRLLTRYVLERLLYRLSISEYRTRFALKGAMLITTWFDAPHRPTRDIDFLAFGASDPETLLSDFRAISAVAADDQVSFDPASFTVERVREDLAYGGLRLRGTAALDGARIPLTIDIGFGDSTEPGLNDASLPVLLDAPVPMLRAYVAETVIAEKFQAMVLLGRANSRMKDYYDIWMLAKTHGFEGGRLPRAIRATFARRNTAVPTEPPDALTQAFANDPAKQRQWADFLAQLDHGAPGLNEVITDLAAFLMPHAEAARTLT
jgi:predicted nucleotidyltransferase component of viral defense system